MNFVVVAIYLIAFAVYYVFDLLSKPEDLRKNVLADLTLFLIIFIGDFLFWWLFVVHACVQLIFTIAYNARVDKINGE